MRIPVTLTAKWLRALVPLVCLAPMAVLASGVGVWITRMEAIQVVQTSAQGVPLIAGKPTFIRVYVRSNERGHGTWKNLSATLSVTGPTGVIRGHTPISPNTITVSSKGSDRTRWDDSFTFLLDDDETLPNSTIAVQAHIFFTTRENDHAPLGDHNLGQVYNFSPALNLSVYAFVMQATKVSPDTPSLDAGAWSDYAPHLTYLNSVYPVSLLTFQPIEGYGKKVQVITGGLAEARAFADKLLANLPAGSLINFMTPWDIGGLHGLSVGNRSEEEREMTGHRPGVTAAQEIAHSLGLPCHTFNSPCANPPYQPSTYPRPNGRIDWDDLGLYPTYPIRLINVHGVRVLGGATMGAMVGVPNYLGRDDVHWVSDFMSYNVPPWTWVSSVTYCGLLQAVLDRLSVTATSQWSGNCTAVSSSRDFAIDRRGAIAEAASRVHLHVNGVFDNNGRAATFDAFDEIVTSRPPVIRPGPYRIVFLDGEGREVRSVSFDRGSRHPGWAPGREPFSLLIPFDDISITTKAIILNRGDVTLARRDVPEAAPTISLIESLGAGDIAQGVRAIRWNSADPVGNSLTHTVEYSKDGGKTWTPVAVDVKGDSVQVDFDQVAGSDSGVIRVRASNGVRTATATSTNPFRVLPKAPYVSVQSPLPKTIIVRGVPFVASGSATTLESGPVSDPTLYEWSSSRDGPLGHGRWIALNNLSVGEHELMLSVLGPGNIRSSTSVSIEVRQPAGVRGQAPTRN